MSLDNTAANNTLNNPYQRNQSHIGLQEYGRESQFGTSEGNQDLNEVFYGPKDDFESNQKMNLSKNQVIPEAFQTEQNQAQQKECFTIRMKITVVAVFSILVVIGVALGVIFGVAVDLSPQTSQQNYGYSQNQNQNDDYDSSSSVNNQNLLSSANNQQQSSSPSNQEASSSSPSANSQSSSSQQSNTQTNTVNVNLKSGQQVGLRYCSTIRCTQCIGIIILDSNGVQQQGGYCSQCESSYSIQNEQCVYQAPTQSQSSSNQIVIGGGSNANWCDANCDSCNSKGLSSTCNYCKTNYNLYNNKCITCPSSSYHDSGKCVSCKPQCAICSYSYIFGEKHCSKCNDNAKWKSSFSYDCVLK